jgi:hypothetical protein
MNQSDFEAAPVGSTPPPMPSYKDRSMGLSAFGILTIMLGCVAGLFVLLTLFQTAYAGTRTAGLGFSDMLPVISIYGAIAVTLVWLGIGSIMARRWARALLLIFSWCWLLIGVLSICSMAFLLPRMLANMRAAGTAGRPALPPAAQNIMMAVMFLFLGVFAVIVPAVWIFFYKSRHVKATCETRDPVPRWTDACPLPVLGLCVVVMVSAPMMLLMPFSGHVVMPFFGMFLTGIAGSILWLAFAGIWFYAAWSLYKLERRGWWLILIAVCVSMVSALLTFARHDMTEMYSLMDYPPAQLEQIQNSGMLFGNHMAWLMAFSMLPFLGYLLYIKKFLRRSGDEANPKQIPVGSCQ